MKTKHSTMIKLLLASIALPATPWVTHAKDAPASVICRIETDRTALPANQANTAVIKVTLEAPPAPQEDKRPPLNLCLVLDQSSSMRGEKLEQAKASAVEVVERLSERDIFSLVVYSSGVETLIPAAPLKNREHVIERIRRIQASGNTALFGGVSQGASEIRKNLQDGLVHRIVLLSDGQANVGPSSPADLGRLGASLMKERISVTTVGLGADYNEDLMTQLAGKSDGNSYYVAETGDLPRIFKAEMGEALSVVATEVKIEIHLPEGVRPIRLIGREGRIDSGKVELELNQLYGGQKKYALLEVEVPANASTETPQHIAEARCSYENLLTRAPEQRTASAKVSFTEDVNVVAQSKNIAVEKEVIVNVAADNRNQAIVLWEAGKKEEAQKLITANGFLYSEWGAKNNDAEALKWAEQEKTYELKLTQEGLSKDNRKELRTRSYQDTNQQMAK